MLLLARRIQDRTWCNGFKLKDGQFRLDIRNDFFIRKVVTHWHRLSRAAMDASALKIFKVRLDRTWYNLV